jgi:tubulin polyglutamylase TTLL4
LCIKNLFFSFLQQSRKNILDVFTPDDIRILIETEDEFARRGSFERIFPTNQTRKYLKYFETPRYYNILLNEWITKYSRLEERGKIFLQLRKCASFFCQ